MSVYLIRNYTPHNWTQIAPLVAEWEFKPLSYHFKQDTPEMLAFTFERVRASLNNRSNAWVAMCGNKVRGFANYSFLTWDSEQLGMPTARIDHLIAHGTYQEQQHIKTNLIEQLIADAQSQGIWHLSVRIDASDLSSLHVLEEAGFITVDSLLSYAINTKNFESQKIENDFSIRLATPDDTERAAELALEAYTMDRFHSDPFITTKKANELHANWLRNSCNGRAADAVVIAEDETGLLGFVTCKLQRDTEAVLRQLVGTIVLVATSANARGRGVGQAMTFAALDWFRSQSCEVVEVGTQLRNVPASRLYQKCGFSLVGSSVSLRRLL